MQIAPSMGTLGPRTTLVPAFPPCLLVLQCRFVVCPFQGFLGTCVGHCGSEKAQNHQFEQVEGVWKQFWENLFLTTFGIPYTNVTLTWYLR